jgi:bifunctional non-homologous end joining protein LigD
LKPLETAKNPFGKRIDVLRKVTWVEPRLVCEVKFTEWTKDGRLRAPVFLGLREDKPATEAVREAAPDEPRFPPGRKEVATHIEGKTLKFTNLDKVWFPNDGFTKRDILNYYDAVADWMVPHLAGHPLSLKRYPNGIHEDFFFQKDIPEGYPGWLRIEPIFSEHRGEPIRYVVADDRATLLFLTNLGCIDQNPWMSRIETLDYPDYVLIDLDPQECTFDRIIEAMGLVKDVLDEIGLKGYPKTTGGDGMHVFVPVEPRYTYEQARSFAEIISQVVIGQRPELFTTPRSVAKRRKGRVYFDYLQISSAKTIAAPYVLRAYDGAPVATPLQWDEVKKGLTPRTFNLTNAVDRFREMGDLFQPVLTKRQKLEPALKKLAKLLKD